MTRAEVLTWDWREQPDLDTLARIVTDLSDGRVHLYKVTTGTDEYAVVFADQVLTPDAAQEAYRTQWETP